MKLVKLFFLLIIGMVLVFSLVSADVVSINSGGGLGFIINPDMYLEGFFGLVNTLPVVSNLVLSSSLLGNTTNENLSISYDSIDSDGDAITNITDWRLDGTSLAVLNIPFDTNDDSVAKDYSTYGNNGSITGATWTSDGKVGGAYSFDGDGDWINISNGSDFSFTDGSGNDKPFSFSMWLNPTSVSTKWIVTKRDWNVVDQYQILLTTNYLHMTLFTTGTNYIEYRIPISNIPTSEWSHLAIIYDGGEISSSAKMYVDGFEITTSFATSGTYTGMPQSDSELFIGATTLGSLEYIGSIDEVQVFNRSLSVEQINAMYQAGLAGHQVEEMVSQETDKGDVWQVALTPNDAIGDGDTILSNTLTIIDSSPEDPSSVSLISVDGTDESDADLNCSAFIEDVDNTQLTVYMNWFKDDVSVLNQTFTDQGNGTIVSSILGSGNLTLGDIWKCSVQSYDGNDYSSWVDSNELTIIDITAPNITIISPLSTPGYNYTTLEVDFNVSVSDNEDGSACLYDLDAEGNVSMTAINSTYYWYEPTLGPGNHSVIFYCNDTSNNWNSSSVDFEILNEAAISISISTNLSSGVEWYLASLPANDLDALGNNDSGVTGYYINISATNTDVDLYLKADGDLLNVGLDVLGLGNETYRYNVTDSTVANGTNITMTTSYSLIGEGLVDGDVVYLKFFLDAPVAQAAGSYTNGLDIKAVRGGQSP